MTKLAFRDPLARGVFMLLIFSLAVAAAQSPQASEGLPRSSSPALESPAKAFAEQRLEAASREFERLSQNTSAPPFTRGLAMLGLAEVALARDDFAAAISVWQRLDADTNLLQYHRETARRRISEAKRVLQGLSERNLADHRVKLPPLPEPAVTFHVAPNGNNAGDGSANRPFRTLERARDAVREFRKAHGGQPPKGGVRVLVAGGTYPIKRGFNLIAQDSGTAEAPVIYQARFGEHPVLAGGIRIRGWKPITSTRLGERLAPSVRTHVVEASLEELGADWGDPTALRRRPELFVNGRPQTLARWPNEGFTQTGDILGQETFKVWNRIEGCRDRKFGYLGDQPSRWLDEPDIRLYGYWFWDWFEEYQKVALIDPDTRSFTLSPPYSNYGYRKGQRYYAVNIFCELDSPGEWYLDRRNEMVYWLPPQGIEPSEAQTILTVFEEPAVVLNEVNHVILLGLTLQEGRGDGIHIRGGANCLIAGCTLRRFGGDAITITGGRHHGIFGCTMNALGCGGARVAGGDRRELIPGHHSVENCTVFDISRLKRTYTPAVHLDGCGNRIAHNLFERIPSSAMRIEGNDHLIELNVIRNVVQESDDQGGLDMWGNPLYRGVVIRWNRWSDIRGGTHNGAAGVRLDDMISGVTVHGNIFERCGSVKFGGVQIHGGKENLVDGNLFVDCFAGISFSRWGQKRWLESTRRFLEQAARPPYASRYPALAKLTESADVNFISRNLFAHCESAFLRDGGVQQTVLNGLSDESLEPHVVSEQESLEGIRRFKQCLSETIPLEEMGPYEHPWRAESPMTGTDRRL